MICPFRTVNRAAQPSSGRENGRSAQAVAIADLCGAVGPFCDIHQVELGSAAGGFTVSAASRRVVSTSSDTV